jgi:hypothetical protein
MKVFFAKTTRPQIFLITCEAGLCWCMHRGHYWLPSHLSSHARLNLPYEYSTETTTIPFHLEHHTSNNAIYFTQPFPTLEAWKPSTSVITEYLSKAARMNSETSDASWLGSLTNDFVMNENDGFLVDFNKVPPLNNNLRGDLDAHQGDVFSTQGVGSGGEGGWYTAQGNLIRQAKTRMKVTFEIGYSASEICLRTIPSHSGQLQFCFCSKCENGPLLATGGVGGNAFASSSYHTGGGMPAIDSALNNLSEVWESSSGVSSLNNSRNLRSTTNTDGSFTSSSRSPKSPKKSSQQHSNFTGVSKNKNPERKNHPLAAIDELDLALQSDPNTSTDFKWKSSRLFHELRQLINNEMSEMNFEMTDLDVMNPFATIKVVPTTSRSASTSSPVPITDSNDSGTDLSSKRSYYSVTKPYQCTYPKCTYASTSPVDWKRHEEKDKHWPQKRFMCLECPICKIGLQGRILCRYCRIHVPIMEEIRVHNLACDVARKNGTTFARKDKLVEHLQKDHSMDRAAALDQTLQWYYDIDSKWPRQCGFCASAFEDWDERATHLVEDHFKHGARIEEWQPSQYEILAAFSSDGKRHKAAGRFVPKLRERALEKMKLISRKPLSGEGKEKIENRKAAEIDKLRQEELKRQVAESAAAPGTKRRSSKRAAISSSTTTSERDRSNARRREDLQAKIPQNQFNHQSYSNVELQEMPHESSPNPPSFFSPLYDTFNSYGGPYPEVADNSPNVQASGIYIDAHVPSYSSNLFGGPSPMSLPQTGHQDDTNERDEDRRKIQDRLSKMTSEEKKGAREGYNKLFDEQTTAERLYSGSQSVEEARNMAQLRMGSEQAQKRMDMENDLNAWTEESIEPVSNLYVPPAKRGKGRKSLAAEKSKDIESFSDTVDQVATAPTRGNAQKRKGKMAEQDTPIDLDLDMESQAFSGRQMNYSSPTSRMSSMAIPPPPSGLRRLSIESGGSIVEPSWRIRETAKAKKTEGASVPEWRRRSSQGLISEPHLEKLAPPVSSRQSLQSRSNFPERNKHRQDILPHLERPAHNIMGYRSVPPATPMQYDPPQDNGSSPERSYTQSAAAPAASIHNDPTYYGQAPVPSFDSAPITPSRIIPDRQTDQLMSFVSTSMFASRSSSVRMTGPGVSSSKVRDGSIVSSKLGTPPPPQDQQPATSASAFSLLAGLGSEEQENPASAPMQLATVPSLKKCKKGKKSKQTAETVVEIPSESKVKKGDHDLLKATIEAVAHSSSESEEEYGEEDDEMSDSEFAKNEEENEEKEEEDEDQGFGLFDDGSPIEENPDFPGRSAPTSQGMHEMALPKARKLKETPDLDEIYVQQPYKIRKEAELGNEEGTGLFDDVDNHDYDEEQGDEEAKSPFDDDATTSIEERITIRERQYALERLVCQGISEPDHDEIWEEPDAHAADRVHIKKKRTAANARIFRAEDEYNPYKSSQDDGKAVVNNKEGEEEGKDARDIAEVMERLYIGDVKLEKGVKLEHQDGLEGAQGEIKEEKRKEDLKMEGMERLIMLEGSS